MSEPKQRHGCLTAVLILFLVANSAAATAYLFAGEAIMETMPTNSPDWIVPLLVITSIFNVICTIALLQWKIWGFWGFILSSFIAFGINLSLGLGIGQSLTGLLGIALLYGTLQIGQENKGWPQLD